MTWRILFVDDEPLVLQGLQRMLRSQRSTWQMTFVEGGLQALEAMTETPFDVIVTDMRMPEMDGAELLRRVRDLHPGTIRMVLSGHADQELVTQCVGVAHQYLSKPCHPERLRERIQDALDVSQAATHGRLKALVASIENLPSLPALYLEMLEALERESTSIQQIGDIIRKDIAMTAKLLKLVNSTFFGLRRTIETPGEAVAYLGMEKIKGLVLAYGIFERAVDFNIPGFSLKDLWRHSLQVANGAHLISHSEGWENLEQDQAFVGGVLHDIGILVLAAHFPGEYAQVLFHVMDGRHPLLEAEQEVFQVTHTEVGAYLLGLWGIPGPIRDIAAHHHRPELQPGLPSRPVLAVHTSDTLSSHQEKHLLFCFTRDQDESLVRSLDPARLRAWSCLLRNQSADAGDAWGLP